MIVSFGSAYAQKPANYDSLSYKQKMDIMLSGIRKDSLKTGILIDRVIGYSGITSIGSDSTKIDTVSEDRFLQVIFELERAVYDSNSFLANAGEKIQAAMGRMKYSDSIPIAIIDIEYETLKDSALLSGLLRYTADSLFETPPNEYRNPFEKHAIRIAVVLESRNTIRNQGYFKIEPSLYFSNTISSFQKLNINFNTVSYELTSLGSSVKFDKNIIGENAKAALELRFQNSTGGLIKTNSKANFPNMVQGLASEFLPCNEVREPYKYFGEPFNSNAYKQALIYDNSVGEFSQGAAYVHLFPSRSNSNCLNGINKVVVILDGFDPEDKRQVKKFYNEQLKITRTTENLGEELRDKGFDIAFVNFPDLTNSTDNEVPALAKVDHGAGLMEANALAVVEFIQETNIILRQNGSNESISIVGPSMGGMIARYALAYMEKRKSEAITDAERLLWEHNCHLYISFDAPHLGANIPIGLQQFLLRESLSNEDAAKFIQKQINTPAARQLLINHIDSRHNAQNLQFETNSVFRSIWANSSLISNGLFGSNGFPLNLRKVAISNGSVIGKRQEYLLTSNWQLLQPRGGDDLLLLTGWISSDYTSGNVLEIKVKALPEETASGVTFRKWVRDPDEPETNEQFPNNFSGGSLDLTAGGYYNGIEIAADKIGRFSKNVYKTNLFGLYVGTAYCHAVARFPIHNFIPVKSSLGCKVGINGLSENLSNRDLVCTGEIPFDDYFIEDENTEHVNISQGMAAYAIAEIEGNYHHRPSKIIEHSREICDNEVIDFNFTNIDFDIPGFITEIVPIDITALPFRLIPVGTAPHKQFRVQFKQDPNNPNSHYLGPWNGEINFTITKSRNNGVNCITQIKEAWHIGGPEIQAIDAMEFCINERKNIILSHLPLNNQSFQISSSNSGCVQVSNNFTMTNAATTIIGAHASSNIGCNCTITIIGTNDCGSVVETINATVLGNCAYADKYVKAMPSIGGPLTEQIEIQVVDAEGVLAGPNVAVELSDSRGTVIKRKITDINSSATFDATNLTVGRYVFSGTTSSGDFLPKQNWFKQGSNPSVLLISPNPAIKGVDQELVGNLMGVKESKGPFQIKIANTNESVLDSLKTDFLEFTFPINNLEEGLYLLSAYTSKDSLIAQEYVTLGIKGRPSLRLTENPVDDKLKGYLENPVVGFTNLSFRVVSFGGLEVATGIGNADSFDLDVAHLLPGSYILTANDGKRAFSVQFQKN